MHRFVLNASIAALINANLQQTASELSISESGIRRSNIGGFHSDEERFEGSGSSSEWYGQLQNVLLEALRMLHHGPEEEEEVATMPGATSLPWARARELNCRGWLNVNDSTHFNLLHDHGDAVWSAVYYVDPGMTAASTAPTPQAAPSASAAAAEGGAAPRRVRPPNDAAYAGALLLRTQLKAFSTDFAYLPVPPSAGDLWIFPGYLPHAVLPRTLPTAESGELQAAKTATPPSASTAPASSQRISVACNVLAPEKPEVNRIARQLLRVQ